jgi:hypothetical protein
VKSSELLRDAVIFCVGFEVLTAVVMKNSIFWDIMLVNVSEEHIASIFRDEKISRASFPLAFTLAFCSVYS